MNNIQKFNELISDSCDFISDTKLYSEIVEALEVLEIIKKHYNEDSLPMSRGTYVSFCVDSKYKDDFNKIIKWLEINKERDI